MKTLSESKGVKMLPFTLSLVPRNSLPWMSSRGPSTAGKALLTLRGIESNKDHTNILNLSTPVKPLGIIRILFFTEFRKPMTDGGIITSTGQSCVVLPASCVTPDWMLRRTCHLNHTFKYCPFMASERPFPTPYILTVTVSIGKNPSNGLRSER